MHIEQKDDGRKGLFYIEQEGALVAEMEYHWQGTETIIITHTEVDESLEGKGIGKQLVEKGVDFARQKNARVIPQCVFAKALIDKTPEWQDVLKARPHGKQRNSKALHQR